MGTERGAVIRFVVWVVALSGPFWLVGALAPREILPGLPLAAIAVLAPALAALIVSAGAGGGAAVRRLLARVLDARRAGAGLALALILNPVFFAAAFVLARGFGADLPLPEITATRVALLIAMFLPAAVLEEIGWSGFALDRLLALTRPFVAALVLGLIWAGWHLPALVEAGRGAEWIGWWALWTVSTRAIMVRLYLVAGHSVFAMALYHTMLNLCWQLYPVSGSWFDPRLMGLITLAVALAAWAWSPRVRGDRGRGD